jgi:sigma-E factor negative regulatory protein RseA
MTKPYDEQLSALVDDELDSSELQLLIRQAQRTDELAERVGRYAVIRDALHRTLPEQVDPSLGRRISAALEEEPAHDGRAPETSRRWMRPTAGLAVAASVALVAIAVWPEQSAGPESESLQTVSTQGVPSGVTGQPVSADSIQWDRLDSDVETRLQEYAVSGGEGREMQLELLTRPVSTQSADN